MTFKFIDLFAGIGGIRLGLMDAGGQCVFTSEINKQCQDVYKQNFEDHNVYGDITQIDPQQIPDHDLLAGGFPCQPFSVIGRYGGFNDTRGTLFFNIADIIKTKRPSMFLLENVPNMMYLDDGRIFKTIIHILKDQLDYDVHYKIIDSSLITVQHRKRIYIVGFKEPRDFRWPDLKEKGIVFKHIADPNPDPSLTLTPKMHVYCKRRLKQGWIPHSIVHPNDKIDTILSTNSHSVIIDTPDGMWRTLSINEVKRAFGYPESFKPHPAYTRAYIQFGNTVVVPVITEIARAMMRAPKARHVQARLFPIENQFIKQTWIKN